MSSFLKYLFTAFEAEPGVISTTRVIVLLGSFLVVITACASFIFSVWTGRPMPDVPLTTSTFILTLLGTLLGAKVIQSAQENKAPAAAPAAPNSQL